MVSIVAAFEFRDRLIIGVFHTLCQPLNVGLHLSKQFFLSDATDSLVVCHESHVAKVVELAEHTLLRELRDACEEHFVQIVALRLQGAEEVAHALTDLLLQLRFVDAVEHRCVVLVDEHHPLVACLAVGGFDDIGESIAEIPVILLFQPIFFLTIIKLGTECL